MTKQVRDWNKDMEIVSMYKKFGERPETEQTLKGTPLVDVLEYYILSYAAEKELVYRLLEWMKDRNDKKLRYGLGRATFNYDDLKRFIEDSRRNVDHVTNEETFKAKYEAEKERADRLEERNKALMAAVVADANGTFSCLAEAREKKLREAIEEEINCHILLGTYKRADELRELLVSLYPKEEEEQK